MASDRDRHGAVQGSQLFTVRLWAEDLGSGQTDWRGKVQHVTSGEARYFRDWPTLEAFLEELLHGIDPEVPRADSEQ
jgi:hypothetical protein